MGLERRRVEPGARRPERVPDLADEGETAIVESLVRTGLVNLGFTPEDARAALDRYAGQVLQGAVDRVAALPCTGDGSWIAASRPEILAVLANAAPDTDG
ncbi:hypothetical protein [Streptacidiphilus cavernicola]|uniref:Uncharacterized protein n=1 Tax=Streptacidiphilus cavernicola TaxID=3342716 RepID=A0ABV6VP93_9ACTN